MSEFQLSCRQAYKNLYKVLEFGNEIDIDISIVSNGRKFSNLHFVESIAKYKIAGISISIEGSKPEIHEKISMVPGSYEETVQGFRNLKNAGFKVSTITTICNTNKHDILNIADFLIYEGQKHLAFNFCLPSLGCKKIASEVLSINSMGACIDEVWSWCKVQGVRVSFITPFLHCKLSTKTLDDIKGGKVWLGGCHMYSGSGIVIDYDLQILPCTHLVNVRLGSLKKENNQIIGIDEFQQLWEVEIKNNFREKLWKYPSEICLSCEKWKDCLGGCPLLWLKYNAVEEIIGN